jgi:hypothetical protein
MMDDNESNYRNETTVDQRNGTIVDWSYELRMSRLILQQYMAQIVVICGICGNCVNVIVLGRKSMRSTSTNCYLLVVAAYDVVYLSLSDVMTWSVVEHPNVKHDAWYIHLVRYAVPFANMVSNSVAWLVCAFTLERYIAVCHPMKGRVWCTARRAKWIIVGVCGFSALLTCPEFFTTNVRKVANSTRVESVPNKEVRIFHHKCVISCLTLCMFPENFLITSCTAHELCV